MLIETLGARTTWAPEPLGARLPIVFQTPQMATQNHWSGSRRNTKHSTGLLDATLDSNSRYTRPTTCLYMLFEKAGSSSTSTFGLSDKDDLDALHQLPLEALQHF
jgi:hypothetical protein